MTETDTMAIHERFHAFQGEGDHAGRAAFFIRTFGCPVHCPWCDSAGTWHKDYVPQQIDRLSVIELSKEAAAHLPEFVVITGGEPTVQPNLSKLIKRLHQTGLRVHIETCGGFWFENTLPDWITLSPKRSQLPTKDNLVAASEIKLIIDTPQAVNEWRAILDGIRMNWQEGRSVWLHPEWSQRNNPEVLNAISAAVKEHWFRAGWQLHKLYQVDSLDPRAKPTVPLGGNPELGPAS